MVRALLQLTKKLIEHVKREYARFTSLEDEGDTIKWRKYKSFYFIDYSIVFLLSRIFFNTVFPFLTVTLPLIYLVSRLSNCEMKWTQGKSDEARAILVMITIYSSYNMLRWI